jgi:hypothetical protein
MPFANEKIDGWKYLPQLVFQYAILGAAGSLIFVTVMSFTGRFALLASSCRETLIPV